MVSRDKQKKNHDVEDWGYDGVKRRDFRADRSTPEVPKHRKFRAKKTKKFCKRSPIGIHVVRIIRNKYAEYYFVDWFSDIAIYQCVYCQKHISCETVRKHNLPLYKVGK